ncbi:hypothetical protein BGZ94_002443 [Podila epigama]|nr:hypothetical protein BGZ94_002443 [Podila epigama]
MSEIYSFLVGPPYPYKPEDGHFWISTRPLEMTPKGTPLDYCIRDMAAGGMAIGSVHISAESDENLDGGDIGYWLAPEYHGKGLVAKALGLLLQEVSIKEVGKRKFNARAFQGNWASRKTMEKVGFVFHEEILLKNRAGEMVPSWTMRLVLTDEDLARREVLEQATPLPELALL